jgi:hypothetical protein
VLAYEQDYENEKLWHLLVTSEFFFSFASAQKHGGVIQKMSYLHRIVRQG